MKHRLLILFIPFLLTVGCNTNQLTKKNAKEQIVRYYQVTPEKSISTVAFEPEIRGKDSGFNGKLFRLYINNGLLKLKHTGHTLSTDSIFSYEITEKGKPYLIKENLSKTGYPILIVKTFDYYVDQITRVKYSPDKKQAAAYFILSIKKYNLFWGWCC